MLLEFPGNVQDDNIVISYYYYAVVQGEGEKQNFRREYRVRIGRHRVGTWACRLYDGCVLNKYHVDTIMVDVIIV